MKIAAIRMVALLALALGGSAWGGPDNTKEAPQQLRLKLDLVDGSHIIGTPNVDSVPVETPYAKMKLPFSQIVGMKIGEDHETVSFDLLNGDTIKGVINLGPIPLETAFGKVTVRIEHIRKLRLLPGGLDGAGTKDGLIAWYNFNDGTANDASENKCNGILRGAKPAPDRSNRPDCAMSFDGKSAWIEVPSSGVYDALTEITIAAWVCPVDDQRHGRSSHFFITKQPSGSLTQDHSPTSSNHGGQFDLNLQVNEGLWHVYVCSQVAPYMCSEGHTFPLKSLKSSQWHHLAVTISREDNRVRVYLDGQKTGDLIYTEQTQTGHILSQPTTEPLRIGKRKDADFDPGSNNYFNGRLDDIRIYNRVLSDDEIKIVCGIRK
jgi:hypothetical protein